MKSTHIAGHIISLVEWELLRDEIRLVEFYGGELPPETSSVVISRDNSYSFSVNAYSSGNPPQLNPKKQLPGEIIQGWTLIAKDEIVRQVELSGVCYRGFNFTQNSNKLYFEHNLEVSEVLIRFPSDQKSAQITDWFINAPNTSLWFHRPTIRKKNGDLVRESKLKTKKNDFDNIQINFDASLSVTSQPMTATNAY